MKEIVKDPKEFANLTKGRTHWIIEQKPLRITDLGGTGIMNTGEYLLILAVSAISKDKSEHVVNLNINFDVHFANTPEYTEKLKEIRGYALKHFPDATEGVFE